MARFSTSPFRKSFWVAAWKNLGVEAWSATAAHATTAATAGTRRAKLELRMWTCLVCRHLNRERANAGDGVIGRHLPLTKRRAVERVEVAAASIGFEHGQDRGRQRRQELAV